MMSYPQPVRTYHQTLTAVQAGRGAEGQMSAPRSPVRTDGTTTDLTLPAHTARTHNPDLGTRNRRISPAISVLLVDSALAIPVIRIMVRMSSVAVDCSLVHYSGLGSI
jgi:hypothetical protein